MKKLFYILSLSLFCSNAVAFDWGGGLMRFCGEHELNANNACIGPTSNCAEQSMYARNYTDEWAIQLLVAMGHNDQGARFCPVQVEGKNKNKGNAWTEYALAGDNCIWLCLPGYTGPECAKSTSDTITTCDPTVLDKTTYQSLVRVASGPNIEDQVTMFNRALGNSCGVHKSQEHDEILAISRWLPSGHGAYARRMIVRARRSGWKDMVSWPALYPADGSSEVLVCKDGYQPNAANDDCVEINFNVCALALACDGWDTGFDETLHVMKKRETENCYEFRCIENGYAFRSATDKTCVQCVTSKRFGVNPVNGTCVECEIGKIFDESSASSGYCVDTKSFTKTELQYGPGQTRNTEPDVNNQCWYKRGPEYSECMGVSTGTETTSDNTESSGE